MLAETLATRVDLVISDVVMPQMGGRMAVERLKEMLPPFKVLFISGFADSLGNAADDQRLLQKPFNRAQLARAVRQQLDEPVQ